MALVTAIEPMELGALTRRLELDSLRLLAVVAREGSYARAARTEPLTASAISKRIADLERTMGYVLLERSAQGVRPTMAGDMVLAHWNELAATLGALMSVPDDVTLSTAVKMAVVADAESARFLVFDCLSHLDALDDDSQVSVTRSSAGWLPVEFAKRSADAAIWKISGGPEGAQSQAVSQALFERFEDVRQYSFTAEVCIAVVRADHPLAPLGLLSGLDLEDYDLVCTSSLQEHVRSRMNVAGDGLLLPGMPRVRLSRPSWSHQVTSTLEYLEGVPTGVVALLPTSARYVLHRYPGLRSLSLTEDQGCIEFGCVMRQGAWLRERTRLLERLTGSSLSPVHMATDLHAELSHVAAAIPSRIEGMKLFPHDEVLANMK